MKFATLTLLLAAPFAAAASVHSYSYVPTDPNRDGDGQGWLTWERVRKPFIWVRPTVNPRLNPKSKVSGPLRRHFMRGNERWIQIWDVTIEDWRDSHIDHIYPDEAIIVPDTKYLYLRQVPKDGQTGLGQGAGGLNPYEYDEDGVKRPAWHGEEVDPIKRPWR